MHEPQDHRLAPAQVPAAPAMTAFRKRLNAFLGHPRTAEFVATLDPPSPRPATTASAALAGGLEQTMKRLGVLSGPSTLRLRKSMTMHDGRIVAMTGDFSALQPGQDVQVVTTTTTVLDQSTMRTETTIVVLERQDPR